MTIASTLRHSSAHRAKVKALRATRYRRYRLAIPLRNMTGRGYEPVRLPRGTFIREERSDSLRGLFIMVVDIKGPYSVPAGVTMLDMGPAPIGDFPAQHRNTDMRAAIEAMPRRAAPFPWIT